jgi:ABC-type lipoprotein release transport system permease subunit
MSSNPSWTGFEFEDYAPPAAPQPLAGPPVLWLGLGALASLAGGTIAALLGESLLWALVGWALSGPVAIGLLGRFTQLDTRRKALPSRLDYRWVAPVYVASLVVALVAVILSALRIGLWAGTQW